MIVFLHSPNQDKGTRAIDFCMASLSALEDKHVQRSLFGVLSNKILSLLTKLGRSRWLDIYGPARLRLGP